MLDDATIGTDDECRILHAEKQLYGLKILYDAVRRAAVKIVNQDDKRFNLALGQQRSEFLSERPYVNRFVLRRALPQIAAVIELRSLRLLRIGLLVRSEELTQAGRRKYGGRNRRRAARHSRRGRRQHCILEGKPHQAHRIDALEKPERVLANLRAESLMQVELHQHGAQDCRLGVVVALELPGVDIDDGCPFALDGFQTALLPG